MEDVKTIVIDNIEYNVIDEILIDNTKYVYLAEDVDPTNFIIQKISIVDGADLLVNLEDEEEFNKALMKFNEKNHE